MIILSDEEKAFDKIPTPIYNKTLRKKKKEKTNRVELPPLNTEHQQNTYSKHYT